MNKVHNNLYDYSKVNYVSNKKKIIIICKEHGEFLQRPVNHSNGQGCPKCKIKLHLKNRTKTKEDFINESNLIHNNKYDYTISKYINHATKLKIICPQHGIFVQRPNQHLRGEACPKCNSSKGEIAIRNYLVNKKFSFKEQVGFETCRNKRKLPFDFVLTIDKEYIIEFYGEQHYNLVNFTNNRNKAFLKFEQIKLHDNIKQNWCNHNNIPLCVIPYWEIQQVQGIIENFLPKSV